MKEIEKISASKLSMYFGCPWAWYMHYVARIKVPSSSKLVFGAAIHEHLKQFYEKNYKTAESYAGAWRYYWYGIVNKEFGRKEDVKWGKEGEEHIFANLGSSICTKFYEKNRPLPRPMAVERPFKLEIEINVPEIGKRKIFIDGVYDRIDLFKKDGHLIPVVSDYKSDYNLPSDGYLKNHQQLTMYSMSFEKDYGVIPLVGLYHLRSGNTKYTKKTEKDHEFLKSKIAEAIGKIEKKDFTPFYGFHCNHWCDYSDVCEKYRVKKKLEGGIIVEGDDKEIIEANWENRTILGPEDVNAKRIEDNLVDLFRENQNLDYENLKRKQSRL